MTWQELEKRLADDAEDCCAREFRWGIPLEAGEGVISFVLIRESHREPRSIYTPVEMPKEWEQWQSLTELWEVEWQSFYQITEVDFIRRPLHPNEDPRDYPQETDCLRCEIHTVRGLDGVEEVLGRGGKSLTDVGPLIVPHIPYVTAT